MKCPEPGCDGEIYEGYCTVTGMKITALLPDPTPPSGTSATTGAPRGTSRATTSAPRPLGGGLVAFAPVAEHDPSAAVLDDPSVSEEKRFCPNCNEAVGRSHDGVPGRAEGFCRKCGHPFSFIPKLRAGALVGGRYEVAGCIAHGGFGWIYLARDHKLEKRWVVLKGLLNRGDADARENALNELRFLVEVKHHNIVEVYDFTEHETDGYIVMDYVAGTSLHRVLAIRREANGGTPDPLPVAHAIAYILEILPALGYLHRHGLLFCDLKPANVIQTPDSVKLIDLGGVYRMDDQSSPIYGTVGYQAPEIARTGPTVPSDLFTVGRTLAVLCTNFRGYQSTFQFTLPPPRDVPLFATYDSLYQFLARATESDPAERFQSADEMAGQLYGVLREVVAREEGTTVVRASTLFTGELRSARVRPDWRALPAPLVAVDDPSAPLLATVTAAAEGQELVELLEQVPQPTIEVKLQLARVLLDLDRFREAEEVLGAIDDAWDWRVAWHRGLARLAGDRPLTAVEPFSTVFRAFPGELAPKLALALASEAAGAFDNAARWYDIVSRTDPTFTNAAFGLARSRLALGDRAGAVSAYDRVPEASNAATDARIAKAETMLGGEEGTIAIADVLAAGAVIERLALTGEPRARMTALVLEAALRLVGRDGAPDPTPFVLGCRLDGSGVRRGLEETYRALAQHSPVGLERINFVDRANAVRPRTLT